MHRAQLEKRQYEGAIIVEPAWHTTLGHLWGIVLAGGEGRRLQSFIRACFGCECPKQCCAFINGHSMLHHTPKWAEGLLPPARLVTIVTRAHLHHALVELRGCPPDTMIVQPENRETGPGILLPLIHVLRCDPETVVVLLPSDHFISLAAETIAMADGGRIGAATPVTVGEPRAPAQPVAEKTVSYIRKEFRATAEGRKRPPMLAEAMVDADVEIPGVIDKGKLLTLTTEEALQHKVADVRANSIEAVLTALHLADTEVRLASQS